MRQPLRPGLPPLPPAMKRLPVDARGFPVPFFVAWIDGAPDHRVAEPIKVMRCVRDGLCWICGQRLSGPLVCVIGPMCGVNHVSSEPPSHEACALFAVRGCPFLSKPNMRRRDAGLPEDIVAAPGNMILRNPGVSLVWWTNRVETFKVQSTPRQRGFLFDVGEPSRVEWWTEGRHATRAEVEQAIAAGLPTLQVLAQTDDDRAELDAATERLRAWLPAEG